MPLIEGRHACSECGEYLSPGRNKSRWREGVRVAERAVLFHFVTADVAVYTRLNEARLKRGLKYLFQLNPEGLKEKNNLSYQELVPT